MPKKHSIPENHRALSCRQPFVEQIMRKEKTLEFRGYPTKVRGLVYLYASKNHDVEDFEYTCIEPDDVPYGVIVGTVEIVDCTGKGTSYQWHLKNPKRFKVPLKPTRQPQPSFFFAFEM